MANSDNANRRDPALTPSAGAPETDERKRREERILDAAATLLVRWGYRKTTIDDVAREAGVGKGTIYLHWREKTELFNAAIWRASEQVTDDVLRRIAADPAGGQFHRIWTHGLLAIYANPLLAMLMRGKSDLLRGLMDTLPDAMKRRLLGNAEAHIVQLQAAGFIRRELPVATITFLMGALKMGLVAMPEILEPAATPTDAQLTDALSDLIRRWLEPADLPADNDAGKDIIGEWLRDSNAIARRATTSEGDTQ